MYKTLTNLDTDEGIRIENSIGLKKIFVNRNLLGTYIVLIRNTEINGGKNTEEILEFIKIENVLEFINKNMNVFEVWTYWNCILNMIIVLKLLDQQL